MKRNYICASEKFNTIDEHVSAPIFKREFDIDYNNCSKYRIEITVAGLYRLFINGTEITKGFLAPYISNADHYVYYDEYDVSSLLKEKGNVIKVLLGNGFNNCNDCGIWNYETAPYRSSPYFALELYDNNKIILNTDEKFLVADSGITFDDLRCGEHFDSRVKESYRNIIFREAPKGIRRKADVPPLVVERIIKPKKIIKNKLGYIYDFGENNSGVCKLQIDGVSGQKIVLSHGEVIQGNDIDLSTAAIRGRNKEGYIQQEEYIAKEGYQEYIPSFTYHGFRYVQVEGVTEEQATKNLLTYLVIHSDLEQTGKFSCSNYIVNKIQQCTINSDLSNFYYFPTDCPQREKNGWTADIALSAEQLMYNFDCQSSLREWLFNLRKAQLKSGKLPGICPTSDWGYDWGNGPAWDSVLIELVYQIYRFTGNKEVIYENKEAMLLYFEYLETRRNDNGLFGFGLGDWCEAGKPSEEIYSTDVEVTDSIVCMALASKMAYLMDVTGDKENLLKFRNFERNLKDNFRAKYIKNGKSLMETQTALAMEITNNVFNDNELKGAYNQLVDLMKKYDCHIQTGVIGVKYLFDALEEAGRSDIALKAITTKDFPGYAYNIAHGATTLWECFNEFIESDSAVKRKDGGRLLSFNHHFWGSVSAWFYKYIAGIKIVSCEEVEISPDLSLPMNWAEAEYVSGTRRIGVKWKRKGKDVELKVTNHGYKGKIKVKGYSNQDKESVDIEQGTITYLLTENN